MKVLSKIQDKKIKTQNVLVEFSYEEYLGFAKDILESNPYQRKRVSSSKTIYSQLKNDMIAGCVIPPIVLASTETVETDSLSVSDLKSSFILDGLQRTFTLIDAHEEILRSEDREKIDQFLNQQIRVEIYTGINQFGILYRMLTLNTGQTPMSLRHQVEILYHHFDLDTEEFKLYKEIDKGRATKLGEYKFDTMIDGFMSYLQASYLPINKSTLLETIKTLDTITNENLHQDLFKSFITLYNDFGKKLDETSSEQIDEYIETIADDSLYEASGAEIDKYLFANNIFSFVSKSQLVTAFGAALAELKEHSVIDSMKDLRVSIGNISAQDVEWFSELNAKLYEIKQRSSKIGNAQRMYLNAFVTFLFTPSVNPAFDLLTAVKLANERYDVVAGR